MQRLSFLEELTHRVIPAGVSLGLFHPMSVMQTRRQQYSFNSKHMIWHMLSKEGLRSFYCGSRALLLQTAALRTTFFSVYKACSQQIDRFGLFQTLPQTKILVTVAASAFAHSLICSPFELIQTKLERARIRTISSSPTFRGVVGRIWATQGFRGFFRGMATTMLRDCASLTVLFSTYFQLCALLAPNGQSSRVRRFVSAGLAGVAGSVVSVPVDMVRRRIQSSGSNWSVRGLHGFGILRRLARLASVSKRGEVCSAIGRNCVQAFLSTAVVFFAWELCQENLRFR